MDEQGVFFCKTFFCSVGHFHPAQWQQICSSQHMCEPTVPPSTAVALNGLRDEAALLGKLVRPRSLLVPQTQRCVCEMCVQKSKGGEAAVGTGHEDELQKGSGEWLSRRVQRYLALTPDKQWCAL